MLGLEGKCWQPWSYGGDRQFLEQNTAFLICDEAQRMQVQLRCWLERLKPRAASTTICNLPTCTGHLLKLRIELQPFQIALSGNYEAAAEIGLDLSTAHLAHLQQRCGGNNACKTSGQRRVPRTRRPSPGPWPVDRYYAFHHCCLDVPSCSPLPGTWTE